MRDSKRVAYDVGHGDKGILFSFSSSLLSFL